MNIELRFVTLPGGENILQLGTRDGYGSTLWQTPGLTHWDWLSPGEQAEIRAVLNLDEKGYFHV